MLHRLVVRDGVTAEGEKCEKNQDRQPGNNGNIVALSRRRVLKTPDLLCRESSRMS
jgi:hypothetical protein